MLWKLLAADIECFEGIGAVGTVFEKIFVLIKKVQIKLCVTGDDADGCCPQSDDSAVSVPRVAV